MIIRLKMPIGYQFLLLFIAISVPFVCLNNCHIWATSVPVHCHVCTLIAIGISVPYQLPQVGQLCGPPVECLLGRRKRVGPIQSSFAVHS